MGGTKQQWWEYWQWRAEQAELAELEEAAEKAEAQLRLQLSCVCRSMVRPLTQSLDDRLVDLACDVNKKYNE